MHNTLPEHTCHGARGTFHAAFYLSFVAASGESIPAHAKSEYLLNVSEDYPPVWRNITIVNSQCVNPFSQVEQIDMFADSATAAMDLAEKRRVFFGDSDIRPLTML